MYFAIVLSAWTERVPGKLLAMLPVRVRMIQALRSARLNQKAFWNYMDARGPRGRLAKERDMAVDVVAAVVMLEPTPAYLRKNVLHF